MKKNLLICLKLSMLLLSLIILTNQARSQEFSVYEFDTTAFPKVKLHVVARDAMNKEIKDLTKSDFSVKESGNSMDATLDYGCQKENKFPPVSITLILDISGSMNDPVGDGEKRFDWVKLGAKAFIDSAKLDPPSSLSIITFGGDIRDLSGFTSIKADLYTFLDKLNPPQGTTDFAPPFLKAGDGAIDQLKTRPDYIRRVIVFLSDGTPERPFKTADIDRIIQLSKENGIQVYGIFLNAPLNDDINWISEQSGGTSFRVDTKQDLINIYRQIIGEIQSSFFCTLSWIAPYGCDATEAGRTRPVEVTYKKKPITETTSYVAPYSSVSRMEVSVSQLIFGAPGSGISKQTFTLTPRVSDFNLESFAFSPSNGDFTIDWQGGIQPTVLPKNVSYTVTVNYVESPPTPSHEVKLQLNTTPCPTAEVSLIAPCGGEALLTKDCGKHAVLTSTDFTETCIFKNTTMLPISGDAQLVDPNNDFSIVTGSGPFTLGPDKCLSMTIRFKPGTAGKKTALIKFNIPDICGEPETALSGEGVTSAFPMPDLPFGEKRVLTVTNDKYILTNSSAIGVKVTSIALKTAGDKNFIATLPAVPFDIAANGGTVEIPVQFIPQAEGPVDNFIEIEVENISGKLSGRLTGTGILPKITAYAPTFAPLKVGNKSPNSNLVINNPSTTAPMKVKEIKFLAPTTEFAFETASLTGLTVAKNNGQITVPMSFTPGAAGNRTAKILVKSDAAKGPNADPDAFDTLLVQGEGLGLDINPSTVDFATILTCDTKEVDVRINNTGTSAMTVSSANVDDAVNFSSRIVDPTIAAGKSGVIKVKFQPQAKNTFNTIMRVVTSSGEANISLKGSGNDVSTKTVFDKSIDYSTVEPDDLVRFLFDFPIPAISSSPISKVDFVLSYSSRMFLYDSKSSMESSLTGWTWTVKPLGEGKIRISGQGAPVTVDIVSKNTLTLHVFLTEVESSQMIVTPDFGSGLPCIKVAADSMNFMLKTCFTKGRLIRTSSSVSQIQSVSPNPSNTDITVNYSLGIDAVTKIELYNSMGSLVRTVTNEFMNKGNGHKTTIPVSDLSSGVYTLTLQSGPVSETRQIIIIK